MRLVTLGSVQWWPSRLPCGAGRVHSSAATFSCSRCEQWLMTTLYFRTPHSVQAIQTEVLAVPPQSLLDLHSSDSSVDVR